jgi:uncharacterized protein involved in response to NO
MIFGFGAAIIVGTLLAALPSWAGTPELCGTRLMLLVALWLAGRFAMWASPVLPRLLTAAADLALLPALTVMLAPAVWRVHNRRYRLLLPILLALALANGTYQAGVVADDPALARLGLRAAVYAVMLLYVLKGGVLTPIFTANVLGVSGPNHEVKFNTGLEVGAAGAIVLLALLDLGGAPARWVGLVALAGALAHAIRSTRWRGWLVVGQPWLSAMHLSFVWLVLALVLKALTELSGQVRDTAWIHAFTVGSLGLMMLGLMTRVTLRHTGRDVVVPNALRMAYAMMFVASMFRLAASLIGAAGWLIVAAALLWAAALAIYFLSFARTLVSPSLPRTTGRVGS